MKSKNWQSLQNCEMPYVNNGKNYGTGFDMIIIIMMARTSSTSSVTTDKFLLHQYHT